MPRQPGPGLLGVADRPFIFTAKYVPFVPLQRVGPRATFGHPEWTPTNRAIGVVEP